MYNSGGNNYPDYNYQGASYSEGQNQYSYYDPNFTQYGNGRYYGNQNAQYHQSTNFNRFHGNATNGPSHGHRGRGRGRGGYRGERGRGRGQGLNFQHEYEDYKNANSFQPEVVDVRKEGATQDVRKEGATRTVYSAQPQNNDSKSQPPKPRSYQENRYRDNRSQRRQKFQGASGLKGETAPSSEASAMSVNVEEQCKADPDYKAVAEEVVNDDESKLPVKNVSRGKGYAKSREQKSKMLKSRAEAAIGDMVVNKLDVKSKPESLGSLKGKRDCKVSFKDTEEDFSNDIGGNAKRRGKNNVSKGGKPNRKLGPVDDQDQRAKLVEQLTTMEYECSVCCDSIRREVAIWSCQQCFHVFHLHCIKRWARNPCSAVDGTGGGWRCPACQNVAAAFPGQYLCFCNKVRDPEYNRFETPHSCGEVCNKERSCAHLCNILCHPGPCPTCQATVTKTCHCGNFKMTVKCGSAPAVQCQKVCEKMLNCGRHSCKQVCHAAGCAPCAEKITQTCYCGATKREVVCGTSESFSNSFSCKGICGRDLDCGHHQCAKVCHPGTCDTCSLLPGAISRCQCGQTTLEELGVERASCTDPVPCCDKPCDKELNCGPQDARHRCQQRCHEGDCPPCPGNSEVTCRCGNFTTEVSCEEAAKYTDSNPFKCERRCSKKLSCVRHRCTQLCCVATSHECEQICGKKLTCGLHRCEERCHRNNCPTCWQASFTELTCHCGAEVLFPPVACGTKPPECRRACTRDHTCAHPVTHNCHSEERCAPCTHLTEKWCMGKHQIRKNIPCHLTDISCGLPCDKPLPCGVHKCQQTCHKGECLSEGDVCRQPCPTRRRNCEHPCSAPCHGADDKCPQTRCKAEVIIKCTCGRRSEKGQCNVGSSEQDDYQKLASSVLAMQMAGGSDENCVDISQLTNQAAAASTAPLRRLECDKECALQERNRRLALALEIKNPDISSKLGSPNYTDFLQSYANKNLKLVIDAETAFSALVKNAQSSKQKSRSHAFPAMPNVQRRVIHELAPFYGCETVSYDEEPNKNVVATAYKDKCWSPSVNLSTLILREKQLPQPRAPVPIPLFKKESEIRSEAAKSSAAAASSVAWSQRVSGSRPATAIPASHSCSSLSTLEKSSSASSLSKKPSLTNFSSKVVGSGPGASVVPPSLRTPTTKNSPAKAPAPLRSTMTALTKSAKPSASAKPPIDYFDMTD